MQPFFDIAVFAAIIDGLPSIVSIFAVISGVAAIVFSVYVLVRSKTSEVLQKEKEAWKARAERFELENTELIQMGHVKDLEITALHAKTDLDDVRKTQAAVIEILSRQTLTLTEISINFSQLGKTLSAMEARLDKGLVMR